MIMGITRGQLKKELSKISGVADILKSQNGYLKLDNGFIIQWGVTTSSSNPFSVTLPISFASACVHADATLATNNSAGGYVSTDAKSISSVTFRKWSYSGTQNYNWVAIGY